MDILNLFGADPALAQSQAKALEEAMGRRRAAGTVASIIGGPFAGAGRAFLGDADQVQGQLGQAGAFRAQQGLQRERMGQDAAQFGAAQAARAAESAAMERYRGAQLGLEREKMGLLREKAAADSLPKPANTQKVADNLRKEFQGHGTFKNTQLVSESFRKAQAASGTAAGDMSLIYGYMKLLDPGSAVKEGEYASATNAAGVPDRVRTFFNKVQAGEILAPDVRAGFKAEARRLLGAQAGAYNDLATPYRRMAKERGANEGDVVLDLGLDRLLVDEAPAAPAGQSAPAAAPQRMQGKDGKWYRMTPAGWEAE